MAVFSLFRRWKGAESERKTAETEPNTAEAQGEFAALSDAKTGQKGATRPPERVRSGIPRAKIPSARSAKREAAI
jgi:hypothetical protein